MDILFDPTIRFLAKAAEFRSSRQEILASNIANADTPGYIAKEIPFREFLSRAESTNADTLATTDARHIRTGPGPAGSVPRAENEPDAPRVDGNNVVLEKEMSKLSENLVGYLTEMQFLAKKLHIMQYAIDEAAKA